MPEKKSDKDFQKYTYYSGLSFQMAIIIGLGTFGGVKLDAWLETSPIFTLICSLGSIVLSLYVIVKDLTFINKKKDGKDSH